RRSGQRPAGGEIEVSFVARTVEAAALDLRYDRAGEMRAALVEGDDFALAEAPEQARGVRIGIVERQVAADRQIAEPGHPGRWSGRSAAEQAARDDPGLPDDEGEARQSEEFRELTAGDVLILRNVDGEVAAPARLIGERAAVRRDRQLVGVAHGHVSVSR